MPLRIRWCTESSIWQTNYEEEVSVIIILSLYETVVGNVSTSQPKATRNSVNQIIVIKEPEHLFCVGICLVGRITFYVEQLMKSNDT